MASFWSIVRFYIHYQFLNQHFDFKNLQITSLQKKCKFKEIKSTTFDAHCSNLPFFVQTFPITGYFLTWKFKHFLLLRMECNLQILAQKFKYVWTKVRCHLPWLSNVWRNKKMTKWLKHYRLEYLFFISILRINHILSLR